MTVVPIISTTSPIVRFVSERTPAWGGDPAEPVSFTQGEVVLTDAPGAFHDPDTWAAATLGIAVTDLPYISRHLSVVHNYETRKAALIVFRPEAVYLDIPRREPKPPTRWRPRASVRAATRSPEGKPVLAFGLRVGYWPCLRAPFLELAFHRWRIDLWVGLPSYRPE